MISTTYNRLKLRIGALGKYLKRKVKIIVLLLLALLAVCLLVPYLVQTEQIKATLIERISKPVDAKTTVEKIKWRWLPLPHVTLYNSHILNHDFELNIPKTRIYPNWIALFSKNVTIGRIYLQKPEVSLHPSFFHKSENSFLSLPQAGLVIDDGNFKAVLPDLAGLKYQTLHLENTNLNLRHKDNHIVYNLQSKCSFADHLKIKGKFLPENSAFSANSNIKNFKLQNLLTANKGLFSPVSSSVDIEFDLLGKGNKELQILFNGNLPDFTLQRLEEKALFNFKNAQFVFEKKDNSLKLNLIDLNLINPQLQIEGEIERYHTADEKVPFYRLDLQSHNINLNEVRAKLLSLLGDNKVTQNVCDIVRSGRAKSASYSFNSPSALFSHIEFMGIDVNVESANIYVPDIDLNLEKASGPITIKNGELYGEGLSTWLGNNFGSNGTLLLSLGEEKWNFKLDVDIDADISELPGTLHHLIDSRIFKDEIVKVSGSGRTKGHLNIGDDLRNFSVKVDIPDISNTVVYYNRTLWPLQVQRGSVKYSDSSLSWTGVGGKLGPHVITETSWETSWEDENPQVDITSLSAIIDSKFFLQELHKYPYLSEIDNHLLSTEGVIEITTGKINGPLFDPANWNYDLDLAFNDFNFETSHLPGIVTISKGRMSIKPPNVSIKDVEGSFLDSPVSLSADLKHEQYSDWNGSLSITAPVTTAQANWLRTKNLLPEKTLPVTPSNLDNFKINWDERKITATGTVRNKLLTGNTANADFTLQTDDSDMFDLIVVVENEGEEGQLSIQQHNDSEPIKIGWKGEISQATLSALLAHQYTHNGHLSGDIILTLPSDEKPLNINGKVTISNLQRVWGEMLHQISVRNIVLTGTGNELFVDDMDLEYQNETALINGKLLFTPKKVHLELDQEADIISEKKLAQFIDDLSYFFSKIQGEPEQKIESPTKASSLLTGTINLHAKTFLLGTGDTKEEDRHRYAIQPFKAIVDLSNPYVTTLDITDSQLCSLPIKGVLQWADAYSQKDFTLAAPDGEDLLFEEFLPCLGVKKKFIAGSFNISGKLTDINNDLNAGEFSLKSEKGTLWRLVFLSKIFQLINFTDLYNGLFKEGFPYTLLDLNAHIEKNLLIFDKAVIEGEGLDLLIQGSVNLKNLESNLTVFIVPLKTVDTIIRNIPLIGKTIIRLVGGRKGHIITIPVSVTGNIKDPEVNLMPTKAVGKATIDWILDTVTFPFEFLPGVPPISEGTDHTDIEENKNDDEELTEEIYTEE